MPTTEGATTPDPAPMKIQIPESLKNDLPQTTWGKILSATPVVMTVIATMLAGLASSEMTKASYHLSLAAQQQSKAGDQWSFFQAKRLRGAVQRGTLDVLENTTDAPALDLAQVAPTLASAAPSVRQALQTGELPPLPESRPLPATIQRALAAMETFESDAAVAQAVAALDAQELVAAVAKARDRASAFDELTKPINEVFDALEKSVQASARPVRQAATLSRLRYTTRRYDAEARLNQGVASLIELQVRKSNQVAERHRRRSQRFFFGMLGAQAAVIVSTFSLAARKRSLLWILAALAGLTAAAFALWVYFYV